MKGLEKHWIFLVIGLVVAYFVYYEYKQNSAASVAS